MPSGECMWQSGIFLSRLSSDPQLVSVRRATNLMLSVSQNTHGTYYSRRTLRFGILSSCVYDYFDGELVAIFATRSFALFSGPLSPLNKTKQYGLIDLGFVDEGNHFVTRLYLSMAWFYTPRDGSQDAVWCNTMSVSKWGTYYCSSVQ